MFTSQSEGEANMRSYKTNTGNPNESAFRRDDREEKSKKKSVDARENKGFVQMYPQAFILMRRLMANPKTVNSARLYSVLAQNINKEGAVIAKQSLLAKILDVSVKTIQRHSEFLEAEKAIYRFQIQGGLYVYALNPEQVWAGYDRDKENAPYFTGTIHPARGGSLQYIRKSLNIMIDVAEIAEQARKLKKKEK